MTFNNGENNNKVKEGKICYMCAVSPAVRDDKILPFYSAGKVCQECYEGLHKALKAKSLKGGYHQR